MKAFLVRQCGWKRPRSSSSFLGMHIGSPSRTNLRPAFRVAGKPDPALPILASISRLATASDLLSYQNVYRFWFSTSSDQSDGNGAPRRPSKRFVPQHRRRAGRNFQPDQYSRRIPEGDLDLRVSYVIKLIRAGDLNEGEIQFCRRAMDTYAQNGDKIEKACQLLLRLVDEANHPDSCIKLRASDFNKILRMIGRHQRQQPFQLAKGILELMNDGLASNPDKFPEPDLFTYSAFIFVCTREKEEGLQAAKYADELVTSLETKAEAKGILYCTQGTSVYNNLILAHANLAGDVYGEAKVAEDWLLHLSNLALINEDYGLKPNTWSFNHVLKAWNVAQENKGADRALEILDLMLKLSKDHEEVSPDPVSFSTVVSAFGRRARYDEAQKVFLMARNFFDKQSIRNVNYTNCLNAMVVAFCRAQDMKSIEKSIQWVEESFRYHKESRGKNICLPDVATNTAIVHACLLENKLEGIDKALDYLSFVAEQSSMEKPKLGAPVMTRLKNCLVATACDKRIESARMILSNISQC